jgi:hypothetical protein
MEKLRVHYLDEVVGLGCLLGETGPVLAHIAGREGRQVAQLMHTHVRGRLLRVGGRVRLVKVLQNRGGGRNHTWHTACQG